MARLIQDVMTPNPKVLPPSASIMEAAQAMRDSQIGDVLIVDERNRVRGIVTDRDLVIRALANGSDPGNTSVEKVCSKEVTSVKPTQTTDDAVKAMREKAIRRLPVVDGEGLVGIVSLGDLAQDIDEKSCLGQISAAPPNG